MIIQLNYSWNRIPLSFLEYTHALRDIILFCTAVMCYCYISSNYCWKNYRPCCYIAGVGVTYWRDICCLQVTIWNIFPWMAVHQTLCTAWLWIPFHHLHMSACYIYRTPYCHQNSTGHHILDWNDKNQATICDQNYFLLPNYVTTPVDCLVIKPKLMANNEHNL